MNIFNITIILLLFIINCVISLSTSKKFKLSEITYQDLKLADSNQNLLDKIKLALSTEGILAITNVPKLKTLRRVTLSSVSNCIQNYKKQEKTSSIYTEELADGSARHTLAMQIVGSKGNQY